MTHSAMTLDQIQRVAPSVFANNPFPGVSNRYAFVPTANVVEQMMQEGWGVRSASQSYTRLDEKKGYQKHMIRFTRQADLDQIALATQHGVHRIDRVNALHEFPEVVLTNSHDGTSTYQLHAGLFRLVCSNGLVIADATFAAMRVRHTGDANEIIGASYSILEGMPGLMNQVGAMKNVELTDAERSQFALGGAMLRYGFDKLEDCPINYQRLLDPWRDADEGKSLWTTMNVVQENLMKGKQNIRKGETVYNPETNRMQRPTRTRAIKAVDATIKVNKGVWEMAGALLAAKQ